LDEKIGGGSNEVVARYEVPDLILIQESNNTVKDTVMKKVKPTFKAKLGEVKVWLYVVSPMPAKKRRYNRIKLVLYDKEKTNKWLAEQLGVKSVTVSKGSTNDNQPSIATLFQIAEVLEVGVCELLVAK
jgi:DNA-binding Xre family transcriptional regulator